MTLMMLENEGVENTELVRAIAGLSSGIGHMRDICSCLATGYCIINYYCANGTNGETRNSKESILCMELYSWFRDVLAKEFGGIKCREILGGETNVNPNICPQLIAKTYCKVMDLLEKEGIK